MSLSSFLFIDHMCRVYVILGVWAPKNSVDKDWNTSNGVRLVLYSKSMKTFLEHYIYTVIDVIFPCVEWCPQI